MDDSKLPIEDKPQIIPEDIPEIRTQEGISQGDEEKSENLDSSPKSLEDTEGETGSNSEPKSLEADKLKQHESAGGGNFNFNPSAAGPKSLTSFFWGSKNRKRATVSGSIISLLIGGGIFGITSLSGAAMLVQISHIFQTDLKSVQKISSIRNNNLLKYATPADEGESRLSILGRKTFNDTLKDLNDIGISFNTTPGSNLNDADINMKLLQKQYPELKNLSNDEKVSWLQNKYQDEGVEIPTSNFSTSLDSKGNLTVNVDLSNESDLSMASGFVKTTLGLLANGEADTGLKTRIFNKYFDLPDEFHPLDESQDKVDSEATTIAEKDKVAEDSEQNENAQVEAEADTNVENVDKKAGSTTGKLETALAITGVACLLKNVAGDIVAINRDRIVLPSVIQAMNLISVGEQIQNGSDVSSAQINALETSLENSQGTIFGGTAMQATEGDTSQHGTDLSPDYKSAFNVNSTANAFSDGAGVILKIVTLGGILPTGPVCSQLGQWLLTFGTIAVSLAGEIGSGGTLTGPEALAWGATEGANFAKSAIAIHLITNFILSSSTAASLAKDAFSGPTGGDLLAFGARESANIVGRSSGGVALQNSDKTTLAYEYQKQDQQQFESEPLFARLFDIYDYRSLLGKIADSFSPSLMTNFSDALSGFQGIGHSLFSSLSSIITPSTFASNPPYDWGFPIYSVPNDVLNDPNLADPYTNSTQVETLFTNNTVDPLGVSGNTYQQRAEACFGITIDNSSGQWDITPGQPVNPNDTPYINSDCGNYNGDYNWKRTIMYVLDMRTMQSDACFEGDDQSCNDLTQSNTTSSTTSTATNPATQPAAPTPSPPTIPYDGSGIIANPTHIIDAQWNFSSNKPDLTNISVGMNVGTNGPAINGGTPDGYFYANEFYFPNSNESTKGATSRTGYIGMQDQGNDSAYPVHHILPKSMLMVIYGATSGVAAPGGTTEVCGDPSGEGNSCSLHLAYNWVVGHTYRFDISLAKANDDGNNVWSADFEDTNTGQTIQLGTLDTSVGYGLLSPAVVTFHERFSGPTDSCSEIMPSSVAFSNVTANNGTLVASPASNFTTGSTKCLDLLFNNVTNNVVNSKF